MLGFRVWDSERKEMIYGDGELYMWMDGELGQVRDGLLDKYIPMQATGISDNTGELIYENDILSYEFKEQCKILVVSDLLFFLRQYFSLNVAMTPERLENRMSYINDNTTNNRLNCEVIGNIYENPELLERFKC